MIDALKGAATNKALMHGLQGVTRTRVLHALTLLGNHAEISNVLARSVFVVFLQQSQRIS
jgi:hypothetical protein